MSARQRRVKRKITQLVRMDETRARMYHSNLVDALFGTSPMRRFWETCMMPLGHALGRRGHGERTKAALESARAKRIAAGGYP